jgi:hypothetical protein
MKWFSSLLLCGLTVVVAAAFIAKKKDRPDARFSVPDSSKVTEIRIYTIHPGKMDSFVSAWQKGVYPLRTKAGFKIENAWVVKESNKFIWVISYDGPEGFTAKDSAYYASQPRKVLQPDPAGFVADRQHYFIEPALPR